MGNSRLNLFNPSGEFVRSFGKAGNGPGELNRNYGHLLLTTDQIIVYMQKVIIFDYSGKLIAEIPRVLNDLIEIKNNQIYFHQGIEYSTQTWLNVYDLNGKFVRSEANPNPQVAVSDEYSPDNIINTLVKRFRKPQQMTRYQGGFVQRFAGEYKFQLLDSKRKIKTVFLRDFDRVDHVIDQKEEKNSKGDIVQAARKIVSGDYMDDIQSIVGEIDGYLFLQTANKNPNQLDLDIISPSGDFYSQIKLSGDLILSCQISEGKLLINYKNDTVGPYLKIYSLHFKE